MYFVSKNWDSYINRKDIKASVKVNCTRQVPVNNLKVEQQSDRLVFTWSTNYTFPARSGNKYYIYFDN